MKYSLYRHKQTGFRKIVNNITKEEVHEQHEPQKYAEWRKLAISARRRAEKEQFYKDMGLVKGKTALGRTIWE